MRVFTAPGQLCTAVGQRLGISEYRQIDRSQIDLLQEDGMVGRSIRFSSERSPCGKQMGVRRHHDADSHGFLLDNRTYACGCRHVHRQFHDGSGRTQVIRHDGKILVDERSPERGE